MARSIITGRICAYVVVKVCQCIRSQQHEFIQKMEREEFDVAGWYHHVEAKEAAIKQQQAAAEVEGAALP